MGLARSLQADTVNAIRWFIRALTVVPPRTVPPGETACSSGNLSDRIAVDFSLTRRSIAHIANVDATLCGV
ncbi:hypothetical protein DFQ26_008579, partial [Actinomortierella ambigua]